MCESPCINGWGALEQKLVGCRDVGALVARCAHSVINLGARRGRVSLPGTSVSEQPLDAEDRFDPGHPEGKLVIGLERSTRVTLLAHLSREGCFWHRETPRKGPASGSYGAGTTKNTLAGTTTTLHKKLARSLTWHGRNELPAHAQFKIETRISVFFGELRSPWRWRTNENTHGPPRQYFAIVTDLVRTTAKDIEAVARALNPAWQDLRLKDPSGGSRRVTNVDPTEQCCIDWLNLLSVGRVAIPTNLRLAPPDAVRGGPFGDRAHRVTV
jgi:hypothetical protein